MRLHRVHVRVHFARRVRHIHQRLEFIHRCLFNDTLTNQPRSLTRLTQRSLLHFKHPMPNLAIHRIVRQFNELELRDLDVIHVHRAVAIDLDRPRIRHHDRLIILAHHRQPRPRHAEHTLLVPHHAPIARQLLRIRRILAVLNHQKPLPLNRNVHL